MPDLFGKKQLGRATTGGRFYATPTERVEAGTIYFPDESSLLFGVAEYTVEAGDLGAFATEGTFVFDKSNDWLDSLGRKVFYRPSTGEIVNQDRKGDVLIGFQVLANVPDGKLGVVLTSGENSVVIIVTSTADSGAGSLRQAIADAVDGDVILFDSDVFPVGQTTAILLSSYLTVNKSVSIYGGASDGAGGYTSGASKRYYVYREVEGVKTKVVISSPDDAQDNETILFENVCRVALDGQEIKRLVHLDSTEGAVTQFCGISFKNGFSSAGGGCCYTGNSAEVIFKDCAFINCVATTYGGGVLSHNSSKSTLNNCNITACSANNGGGVYSSNASVNTLNDCTFDGCSANTGGGLYSNSTSQNTLNDCTFDGCSANTGGGLCSTNTSQNTLTDCNISGCSATNGGGIYSNNTSQNTLTDCNISGNTSDLDATRRDAFIGETSVAIINGSNFGALRINVNAQVTVQSGITTVDTLTLLISSGVYVTLAIADGAALTLTGSATIGAATFTSAGRGYLAVAAGIDVSAATLTNVVLCAYGAGLESFDISADGASWTAQDLTTPILLEQKGDGATWTTLADDATGGSYSDSFAIGTTLRAFDGVRFFVASLDAYWQVESFVVASNGGGGAGDVSPSWTISDATITPNAEEV